MMVSVSSIEKGLASYLDSELMPQFQANGIEKVMIGTAASLMIRRSGDIIDSYKDNKLVKMTGIIDEEGNVDLDVLSTELKKNMPKDGVRVDIPVIGSLVFHKSDVDKLYSYINAEGSAV